MKGPLSLLNSLFSCPLDAYLECEMKLPSPTRMTSFLCTYLQSFFFYPFLFRYKRWLLRWCLVTETTVSRAMTLRMTLTFSPFLISYSLQPTTIQCSPWVTYLVKTGHKKAITLACYRKILDKGIMP
jgi:hypothetical protein